MSRKQVAALLILTPLAILCGPVGIGLSTAFQVASLPPSLYPLAYFLRGMAFSLPLLWLGIALGSPIYALIAAFSPSRRHRLVSTMLLAAIAWGSLFFVPNVRGLRQPGLVRMTQRATPLLSAIKTYRTDNGRYPDRLEALVPRYLPEIPGTGAVGYPRFEYRLPNDNALFRSYELRVATSIGVLNWDVFVYWPERNYPAQMYGGSVERIRDWAYVHE